jgi:hypothetical protein
VDIPVQLVIHAQHGQVNLFSIEQSFATLSSSQISSALIEGIPVQLVIHAYHGQVSQAL